VATTASKAERGDGEAAANTILAEKPDRVFLDVQMPEIDGFEMVRKVGADEMPITIFVTAYDRYALRAFEANLTVKSYPPHGAPSSRRLHRDHTGWS
jgi:two-component system, LytTR family, response regulator